MIERILVPDDKRSQFLPRHCGKRHYKLCEMAVQSMARQLSEDYDDFEHDYFWNYYELSNGGWHMGLDSDRTFHVVWPPSNFFEGDMSADAFSITACLYAFSAMCGSREENEIFVPAYRALRRYAAEHAERDLILAAIA